MSHLTYRQIQDLADGRTVEGMDAVRAHVAECQRCTREVALQRSLARAAKEAPLVRTSANFTRKVMEAVDPGSQETWLFKFLGGTGKMLAMLVVLGIVAFALTLLPPSIGASSEPSGFSKIFSEYYQQAAQLLTQASGTVNQKVASQTTTEGSKVLVMTFISIILLVLLDRLILRPILRLRR